MKMQSGKIALDKIYRRRDRYEIPDWQRQEVWGTSKKQNLIDSILRGWKLPKFYFLKVSEDPEEYWVVDGQQRLMAIFDFFDNDLTLSEVSAKEFGGTVYSKLPDKYVDRFDDFEIEYDQIEDAEDATDEEVKKFFQRLQDGLPLTSSEKLNSIHSKLRDFVKKLTEHTFFNKVTASDKRYGHFDIVAKAAAIEVDGLEVGLRYDDLLAVFESQANFSNQSNVAKRLRAALDFLDRGFQERSPALRNRSVIQSLLTLICRLVATGKAEGHEDRLAKFFQTFMEELSKQVVLGQNATDPEYLRFQRTINANVKTGARIRQEILYRKFLSYDPLAYDILDPSAVTEGGLRGAIKQDAIDIATLITNLNDRYASQKGKDLFKPTNKTIQAQARVGRPIETFDDYKTFIDNLYFLFHESVGNRLDGIEPPSFMEVNVLRTGLQHDLDHGDKAKAAAKRKKAGEVFKRYSGETSPESLAPDRFLVVQANLLGALRRDLQVLKWQP